MTKIVNDQGDGPAILMVHGWGQTGGCFSPLVERLQNGHRAITIDLAGHGKAKAADGPYTFSRYCNDIAGVVDRLGVAKQYHLLGWSMGGSIAAAYCLDNAGPLPASLVLISATPRFVDPNGAASMGQHKIAVKKMERMVKADSAAGLRDFIDRFFESGEVIGVEQRKEIEKLLVTADFPPGRQALLETLKELEQTDLTKRYGPYKGKALLIYGALDKICPPMGQKLWNHCLSDITERKIESCGHAPLLTCADRTASEIENFIAGTR